MNKFAQYLKSKKIRQAAFAPRVKSTQATISRLAAGSQNPSPDLAVRIEKETGGAVPAASWPAYAGFGSAEGFRPTQGAAQ